MTVPLYLVGRCSLPTADKKKSLDSLKKICKEDLTLSPLATKAYEISLINCQNRPSTRELVNRLLDNPTLRAFYRNHELTYYGDRIFRDEKALYEDEIKEGFDFYKTYITLLYRIKYNMGNNRAYAALELDLLLLCDIIYIHLRYNSCDGNATFFYCEEDKNKAINVLTETTNVLDKYILLPSSMQTDKIYVFFHSMKEVFEFCINELNKPTVNHVVMRERVHPAHKLRLLMNLSKFPRVGWMLKDEKDIDENELIALNTKIENREVMETELEHVFECLCIALLYLPNKPPKDWEVKYSKEMVMRILLMHHFGDSEKGDITPMLGTRYRNTWVRNSQLLMLSMLVQEADLISPNVADLFELGHSYVTKQRLKKINIGDALDIVQDIGNVQREFKYKYLKHFNLLQFTSEREETFRTTFGEPITYVGKHLRRLLIETYPIFEDS